MDLCGTPVRITFLRIVYHLLQRTCFFEIITYETLKWFLSDAIVANVAIDANVAFDIILDSSPSKALDKSIYIAKGSSLLSVLWRVLSTSSTVLLQNRIDCQRTNCFV